MNFDISLGISLATWQFHVDGVDVLLEGTPLTNESGESPPSLGGIGFYSISTENELYLDDFNFINGNILNRQNIDFIELGIYPNPANKWVNIESNYLIKNIKILNVLGKVVIERNIINTVDVSELSRDLYFIEVQTDHGKAVRRLIKN